LVNYYEKTIPTITKFCQKILPWGKYLESLILLPQGSATGSFTLALYISSFFLPCGGRRLSITL
jgi:hypothetical protein